MFSSNQKLCISCDEKQLPDVVQLILDMHHKNFRKPKLAYQMTNDKRIVIGYYYTEVQDGWNAFMFEYPNRDMVLAAIKQYTASHPSMRFEGGDGSHSPGFLVEAVVPSFADEHDGIINPQYGIFSVRSYNCFYHK